MNIIEPKKSYQALLEITENSKSVINKIISARDELAKALENTNDAGFTSSATNVMSISDTLIGNIQGLVKFLGDESEEGTVKYILKKYADAEVS